MAAPTAPTAPTQPIPSYAELLAQQKASRLGFGRMLLNWRRRNGWSQYTAFTWAEAIGEPKLVISYGNLSVIERARPVSCARSWRQPSPWVMPAVLSGGHWSSGPVTEACRRCRRPSRCPRRL